MKICFISPQTRYLESINSPPLNLLYLNSYLKIHGYNDTQVIDLNIEKEDNIPEADVYAISATTPQFPYALELLDLQKIQNGTTIIGGAHAIALPNSCEPFDKVIIGDGEIALLKCLDDIDKTKKSRTKKSRTKKSRTNNNNDNNNDDNNDNNNDDNNDNNNRKHIYIGAPIENIDTLPMPNRNDIDIRKYNYFIDDKFSTIAITSRGCPFSCHFCQKTNNNVRFHSTEYVLKELQHLINCGCEGVDFQDNVFTMRNDLLYLDILKKMAWRCQIRADEKMKNISLLEKIGCRHVLSGIESGSQKILDIVNKKIDIKKVPNLVKECKSRDIEFRALMIIGLPSETHETVNETVEFLREIEPDSVGVGTFVPYPGTYIYNNIQSFDIKIDKDYEKDYKKWFFRTRRGEYNCIVSTSGLTSQEILEYRNKIDREFNG